MGSKFEDYLAVEKIVVRSAEKKMPKSFAFALDAIQKMENSISKEDRHWPFLEALRFICHSRMGQHREAHEILQSIDEISPHNIAGLLYRTRMETCREMLDIAGLKDVCERAASEIPSCCSDSNVEDLRYYLSFFRTHRRFLEQNGIRIDWNGDTDLYLGACFASQNGNIVIIDLLGEYFDLSEYLDDMLGESMRCQHYECMEYLIDCGADLEPLRNCSGFDEFMEHLAKSGRTPPSFVSRKPLNK